MKVKGNICNLYFGLLEISDEGTDEYVKFKECPPNSSHLNDVDFGV
jgi:hypothetical protein